MQHHDHAVTLPLRLAAEPYAKDGISSSCVSPGIAMTAAAASASTAVRVELGALADDDGIRAFCISELLSRADLLQPLQSAVPSSDISTTGWKTQALLVLVPDVLLVLVLDPVASFVELPFCKVVLVVELPPPLELLL